MSDSEWFYICQRKKKNEKDEQNHDVGRNRIRFNDDGFTPADVVPIVSMNGEEDDFDEEGERTELRCVSERQV